MSCFKDIPNKGHRNDYGYLHSESGSAVDVVVLFLDGDRQSVRLHYQSKNSYCVSSSSISKAYRESRDQFGAVCNVPICGPANSLRTNTLEICRFIDLVVEKSHMLHCYY